MSVSATAVGVDELRPGLWWIRQPIPGPLKVVHVYALETPTGLVLIDAGWPGSESLTALSTSLRTIGADLSDVRGAVFTHWHIDHYGLADALRRETGAWLALPEADASLIGELSRSVETRTDQWLHQVGVNARELEEFRSVLLAGLRRWVPAVPDQLLADGSILDLGRWRLAAMHSPGHTPGHTCFVESNHRIIFSGDHVLSRTTPNISLSLLSSHTASPLDDYMRSLERVLHLDGYTMLPGHEDQMLVAPRAREILQHHSIQLRHAARLVSDGHGTVREVAEMMSWSRPWSELSPQDRLAAISESFSHLEALVRRGCLSRHGNGLVRWQPAQRRANQLGE